jgi:hypothetical protein
MNNIKEIVIDVLRKLRFVKPGFHHAAYPTPGAMFIDNLGPDV